MIDAYLIEHLWEPRHSRSAPFTPNQLGMARELVETNLHLLRGVLREQPEQRSFAYRAAYRRAQWIFGRFGIDIRRSVPAEYDEAAVECMLHVLVNMQATLGQCRQTLIVRCPAGHTGRG